MKGVLKPGTLKNYYTTENYIRKFLVQKKKTNDIFLKHLRYSFIIDFEQYLRKGPSLQNSNPLKNNGVMKHLDKEIGYECVGISAKTGKNVDKIKALMTGKTSIFSGHSGVGKSTLVNAIESSLDLKTAGISEQHKQGQHTTTFAEMFDLSFDARIIDTPGIKGFGIVDMEKYEVGDYFPEFFERKSECKFNNCLHIDEPKCAIKEALEDGEIAWSRYKSYLQILEGEEENYRTDIYGD